MIPPLKTVAVLIATDEGDLAAFDVIGPPGTAQRLYNGVQQLLRSMHAHELPPDPEPETAPAQEGTEAARLEDTVDEQEKINRMELIMQDQLTITELKNNERIGKTYRVITEGYDAYTDSYYGRTYMDAPEIDGRVNFTSSTEINDGEFTDVEVFGINGHDLLGRAIG